MTSPKIKQHGVSIQSFRNLDNTFFRISRISNIALTWFLARRFVSLSSFISRILDFLYWMVCTFIFHGVTVQTENTLTGGIVVRTIFDSDHFDIKKFQIFNVQIYYIWRNPFCDVIRSGKTQDDIYNTFVRSNSSNANSLKFHDWNKLIVTNFKRNVVKSLLGVLY